MRKLFTERSVVIALFIVAFIVFSLANEDARNLKGQGQRPDIKANTSPVRVEEAAKFLPAAARD